MREIAESLDAVLRAVLVFCNSVGSRIHGYLLVRE